MTGLIRPASFSRRNGKARPPKFDPPPVQPTMTSGVSPAWASCLMASSPMTVWCISTWLSTLPSAYRASRVARRHLDRLADRDAQAAGRVRVLGQHRPARVGEVGRARVHRRAVGLHQHLAVGLLVVGRPHHPDLELEPEQRGRERQRAAPLARAGLGGQLGHALGGVVVGLRHGGVRLVRPGRAAALVLVVDPGRGAQVLLQPPGAEQRRRPPQPVDVEHVVRDRRCAGRRTPPARSAPSGTAAPGRPGRPAGRCPGAAAAAGARAGRGSRCTTAAASPTPAGRT